MAITVKKTSGTRKGKCECKTPSPMPFKLPDFMGTKCEVCFIVLDWNKISAPKKGAGGVMKLAYEISGLEVISDTEIRLTMMFDGDQAFNASVPIKKEKADELRQKSSDYIGKMALCEFTEMTEDNMPLRVKVKKIEEREKILITT